MYLWATCISSFCELSALGEDLKYKYDWVVFVVLGITVTSRHSESLSYQTSLNFKSHGFVCGFNFALFSNICFSV